MGPLGSLWAGPAANPVMEDLWPMSIYGGTECHFNPVFRLMNKILRLPFEGKKRKVHTLLLYLCDI